MTARRFYGCHFHSLTVHTPETYRLVCLRSLIPEQEEMTFGDLCSISLNTANRQCGKIIDNAVLRYNAQQMSGTKKDYIKIYEEGKLCTIFKNEAFIHRTSSSVENQENVPQRTGEDSVQVPRVQPVLEAVYSVQKKSCKRKLFTDVKDSDSTVSMVAALLPSDDPTVKEFLKYRRILKSTNDKLLRNFYDAALA
uniref:Uncharacterized protein n=1 Tax=Magallana gigas TaxID=29159 RepID=A0A8W8MM94_MAGGI